jgi:hypothetical protein
VATFDKLKQTIEKATRNAHARDRSSGSVNVAVRKNIQVATNIGEDGSSEHVAAVQHAPIRQGPEAEQ